MAAQLVALSSTAAPCAGVGGIVYSFLAEAKYITSVTTNANGDITNFVMSTTGKWFRWDYDRDNTSNYAQTGARSGRRRSTTQRSLMKFGGYNAAYMKAAQDSEGTCDVVCIHVLTDGTRVTQGIEIDASASGGWTKSKIQQNLITMTALTDTSSNESRFEAVVEGETATKSPMCTLTDAAIAAL